jgi:hypothetical protein
MAQVAECLLSKHKALSSNPSTAKEKKKKYELFMHKFNKFVSCLFIKKKLQSIFDII